MRTDVDRLVLAVCNAGSLARNEDEMVAKVRLLLVEALENERAAYFPNGHGGADSVSPGA